MILQLTDGTTTIDLAGTSPVVGCSYFPSYPEETVQRVARSNRDGDTFEPLGYRNVVDTATVTLDAAPSAILYWYQSVVALLQAARNGLSTVYVKYDARSYVVYRARILTGRPIWPREPLRRILTQTQVTVEISFAWEREPIWQADEYELRLSTLNQPAVLGGVTIYNHTISTQANWFQVAASQVQGEVPTPVRLELKNTTGAPQFYRNYHIGNHVVPSGATIPAMYLQGEAARSGLGTNVANAQSSGGYYIQKILNGTGLLVWDLSSSRVQGMLGRRYKVFLRTPGYSGVAYVRPQIRDVDGLTILWEGDERILPTPQLQLLDLGRAMPVPPGGAGAWAGLTFVLSIRTEGSATVNVDFVQFVPTTSYRHLVQRATEVDTDGIVYDDSDQNRAWWVSTDGLQYDVFRADQSLLKIYPGITNRFFLLQDKTTGSMTVTDTFQVRAFYRPCRLVV